LAIPRNLSSLSKEQWAFITQSTAKVNICSGAVRSGKNFAENIRLIQYAKFEPFGDPTSDLFFCGETKDSVYRIFLEDLIKILGGAIYYNRQRGVGRIFGRNFYVFGFGKESDWERLRGSTGGGALVTEMTLCHPDFMKELEARCSVEGSQIFCDTNPDSPFHWVYTDYINDEVKLATNSVKVFYFNFDSNLHLKQSYKDHLKRTYKPGTLFYKRLILGLWVASEGVVYDSFDTEINIKKSNTIPICDHYCCSIDYGTINPFVFILLGYVNSTRTFYAVSHIYHNGKIKGQKTNGEYVIDILNFIKKQPKKIVDKLKTFVIDPSAASFKIELQKNPEFQSYRIRVKDAINDVIEGIQEVSSLFHQRRLFISEDCNEGLREIPLYVWDKSAQNKGQDKPVKKNDHFLDALRYGVKTPWVKSYTNWNK
jgi:PBSX family phage terminase large subunit